MRAILTYHSIDPSGSPISVAAETFRRHVAWLAEGGVRVLPLSELLRLPEDAAAVALTFDDAFGNFATEAWPLLRERGLPVTLFVPTDHVGRTNQWPGADDPSIPVLSLLDWHGLARVAEEGVALGSHSLSHRDLRLLGADDLAAEMETSAHRIESRTGRRPSAFAYPYGLVADAVVDAARRVYRYACTTRLRTLRPQEDPLKLPRLDAFYLQRPGLLESWGSARFRSYLLLRAALRGVRHAASTYLR